jgi:arylsulfatase A-like enzyme
VSHVDLAPTLLARLGIAPGVALDGLDLSALWSGGSDSPFRERFLYGEGAGGLSYELVAPGYFPIYRSIRRDRYKLVWESEGERYTLYDLERDPQERVDASADAPQVAKALIDELRERYRDASPEPRDENQVELDEEDRERLRALGYLP